MVRLAALALLFSNARPIYPPAKILIRRLSYKVSRICCILSTVLIRYSFLFTEYSCCRRRSEDFSPGTGNDSCCRMMLPPPPVPPSTTTKAEIDAAEVLPPPPLLPPTNTRLLEDCDCDWQLTKANSLRFRPNHHHGDKKASAGMLPMQPVIPPGDHHYHPGGHGGGGSFSNQTINNVDSIEILPIFHKLLEDKRSSTCAFNNKKRYNNGGANGGQNNSAKNRFHSARSCPDMSVRCDIVEYL